MTFLQPQYLSFAKLLNDRLFQIPEYQRAYSWSSKERGDLFSDLLKTHDKEAQVEHFMATVVCLNRGPQMLGVDEFQRMDVVDGQQRLTTLIILLKAIALALEAEHGADSKLARDLNELLVKPDTGDLLLLQTNHDRSHHFANFMRKGIAPAASSGTTLSDRALLGAMEDCKRFVATWQEEGKETSALLALLRNRLYFLLHVLEDEKTVYTVFEVLNSRGLSVSWLDRFKSILMSAAFELSAAANEQLIDELRTVWRQIYEVIGLHQGMSTEALRFAATLWSETSPSRSLGEADAVALLRDSAKGANGIREVAHWLLKVTEACDKVAANRRLNAVTRIVQVRLLAVAIYLRDDISDKDRNRLLARWEKVSFRIYGMLNKDGRTKVGDYVRLAWRVVRKQLSVDDIDKAILAIGREYPISDAIENLRETNCYEGWERELRYFMFRYEEHLARQQRLKFCNEQWERIWMVSASDSIEHIWANSTAPSEHRHRLGNLVLLAPRLNSSLQAIEPPAKVDAYRKTGLLIAGEVADMVDAQGWTASAIQEREDKLLEWAAQEWAD